MLFAASVGLSDNQAAGLNNFRSLQLLLDGRLFQSDARIALYLYYIGLITQKPFLGWGVTGGWISAGYWPHNFFIEMMMSFGILFGTLILVVLLFYIGRILKGFKKPERTLFLIYFSNAFALMVSGTFLQEVSFYICLFLGISCVSQKLSLQSKQKGGNKNG